MVARTSDTVRIADMSTPTISLTIQTAFPQFIAENSDGAALRGNYAGADQETYFVLRDFAQLFDDTTPDFTPLYARLQTLAPLPPNIRLPGESAATR